MRGEASEKEEEREVGRERQAMGKGLRGREGNHEGEREGEGEGERGRRREGGRE